MPKDSSEKKKRSGKKKDENAPKKGLTAFLHYTKDNLDSYKKKHSELKHKDVMRALGQEWNGLSEKDKAPYEKRAKDDKEAYEAKKRAYEALKGKDTTKIQKKKVPDESEAVKKPKTD